MHLCFFVQSPATMQYVYTPVQAVPGAVQYTPVLYQPEELWYPPAPTYATVSPLSYTPVADVAALEATATPPDTTAPQEQSKLGDFGSLQIVRHFHMSWFALVMGWGGCALAINGFPAATEAGGTTKDVFNWIATVVWLWDVAYCVLFSLLLLARILWYPKEFWAMACRPGDFLFFGCVPMGIAVVGMGFPVFGPNIMSEHTAHLIALVIFWIDVVLCVVSMTLPPWLMITKHKYKFETFLATWLLPFVSCVVASALAGAIGEHLDTLSQQKHVMITGYILWGAGMLTAGTIIPVYICKLYLHGLPPAAAGNSVWVVLGPIGQGANAIMMLGRHTGMLQCTGYLCPDGVLDSPTCLCSGRVPETPLASFGYVMPGVSLFLGFVMWGFGLWVFCIAGFTSLYHIRKFNCLVEWLTDWDLGAGKKGMPFSVPWWGMVFPLVTLTMSTYQLHTDTHWTFFMIVGSMFGSLVILFATYIHLKTFQHIVRPEFWRKFHQS